VSIGSYEITSYDYNDDIFMAKVDVSQNAEWVEMAGGEEGCKLASIQWSNNNIYIYGDYDNELSFNGTTINTAGYFSDLFIAKYSDLGNLIWVNEIKSSNGTEEAYDLKVDENDMLYLTGRLASYNTINFGSFNLETTDKDVFISQLSSSGVVNWAEIIGNVYSGSIPGYKQSGITTTVNHIFSTCFDNGSDKIFVHKHEKNGEYVGTYTSGESSGVYCRAIASDNSNNIYLIGKFASTVNFDSFSQTTNGNKDIFVAKVASDFQPISNIVIKINNIETKIYPNPTNGILKLEGENITSVSITDLAGKKLFEKTQIQQKETIDLSEFEMGIYIISIQKDKEIFTTKIIKK